MALESILSAALVYLSRQEDGVSSRLRQTRRTLDGAVDALASFAGRGELVRLRAALVQDLLIGILAARNPRPNGVLPSQVSGRLELHPDEPQHWPPIEGLYDANGLSSRLGEMALLGLAITYEETRTFLVGLTQARAPTPAGRQQIGRASRALISVVSSLGLDPIGYEKAWRRLFTADAASETTGATTIPFASTAPPNVAGASSTGTAPHVARGDHTHGHGDQAGGTLHATATPTMPGFLSDADKGKLDGIAPGATATPLSSTPPPSVAAASSAGSDTSAARSDHTHGHGNQPGGMLHATATPTTPGFMSDADKGKLNGIAPGATKGAHGLLLYLNRFQTLVASSVFGLDGAAVLFTADLTPEVCATSGTCQDWRLEANNVTPTALTVSIFRAPSGSVTYLLTPAVFSLPAGSRAASTAATFTVSPGDRLCALCNQPWSPGGLTIRGRLLP